MKRIITLSLLILIVSYSLIFGYKNITTEKILADKEDYKNIITVWQIDTFEGGKGSRKQFLESIAKQYEKKNTGVFFLVSDYTLEGAEEKIKKGIKPDIISFGLGLTIDNLQVLDGVDGVNGGVINGKTYLSVWCKGKYCLIRNNIKTKKKDFYNKLVVSKTEYSNPLISLCFLDKQFGSIEIKAPLDAYMDFVSGNTEYMLGTQRDIERLKVREMQAEIIPLNEFSDLNQYIGVLTDDEIKYKNSIEYIKFLLSEESQNKLKNISMFSTFYKINCDDENLKKLQSDIKEKTLSPFLDKIKIKEIQETCKEIIIHNGDKLKIKNILI